MAAEGDNCSSVVLISQVCRLETGWVHMGGMGGGGGGGGGIMMIYPSPVGQIKLWILVLS